MSNSLQKLRTAAFNYQAGLCLYCKMPMWQYDSKKFQQKYNLTQKQAKRFLCTAEHLKAKQDGGKNTSGNIAAACLYCNQHRHYRKNPPNPETFQKTITNRIQRGRWHGQEILNKFLSRKSNISSSFLS